MLADKCSADSLGGRGFYAEHRHRSDIPAAYALCSPLADRRTPNSLDIEFARSISPVIANASKDGVQNSADLERS